MARPNYASKLVRNGHRGATSARDFATFEASVRAGYFSVRHLSGPPRTSTDFACAVHDTRGRFVVLVSRVRLCGWVRAGWIEALAESADRGKEYLVTDEGRNVAHASKGAA